MFLALHVEEHSPKMSQHWCEPHHSITVTCSWYRHLSSTCCLLAEVWELHGTRRVQVELGIFSILKVINVGVQAAVKSVSQAGGQR